jgi:hypothetical protein
MRVQRLSSAGFSKSQRALTAAGGFFLHYESEAIGILNCRDKRQGSQDSPS